ncbi:MAG: trehalose-phosphatase [Pseudolabrys sp.]
MVTQTIANDISKLANNQAVAGFTRLDLKSLALLLDVDGTMIDIAPSPTEVHVSDELQSSLGRLVELTGGALALVSGRPIADLDRLFEPLKLPAIGGHGAEMRLSAGGATKRIADLPKAMREQLTGAATPGSGIVVEDKGYSLALHYRNAPQQKEYLRSHIEAGCAAFPGEATAVLPGKAMFEVMRPGIDKGQGVRELMRHAPFAGRVPVFIGDDVTDESVFAMLPEMGGKGFSVSRRFAGLSGIFESPAQVRRALLELSAGGSKL